MKVFSGFDTKYKKKQLDKMINMYGQNNVLLLSKSMLFYMLKVIIPFMWFVLFSVFIIWFFNRNFEMEGIYYGAIPIILMIFLSIIFPIIKAFLDYYMDFSIITPKNVHRYDQEWLRSRDVLTISADSIKTVFVRKRWILYSIFNNGDLIFFTEWDAEKWELTLPYIPKPESKKMQLVNIMKDIGVKK